MKTEKTIYLQHTCAYTRVGIDFILKELSNNLCVNLISNTNYAYANNDYDLQRQHADFFILGLQGNSNHGEVLNFVIKWLPMHCPQAKVIIMAQTHSIGTLKDYLLGLGNVVAVLDSAIKTEELRESLRTIIINAQDIEPRKKQAMPLTHQEIRVLENLLKGIPVLKVARALRIDQKTVSRHKRAALNKLGISSLHGLMKCGNNTHMMNGLLRGED
ncbi:MULTISPECIES: helix-turn-helix transcriptional regulator [unclassified Serratia (in: enterobacteria)]|uniref:helix-turn-helix transcriptional regulator n=1 Tax=unclassified Serratia (in: enterobacteria) TaxID=2647522 RepID=UPI0030766F02